LKSPQQLFVAANDKILEGRGLFEFKVEQQLLLRAHRYPDNCETAWRGVISGKIRVKFLSLECSPIQDADGGLGESFLIL
jgi:hypothetical protein